MKFLLSGVFLFLSLSATIAQTSQDWNRWGGPDGNFSVKSQTAWDPAKILKPRTVWKFSAGEGYSSVSISGERLYTAGHKSGKDVVYCLNSTTGAVIWEYSFESGAGSYPGPRATAVIDGESVFFISRRGILLSLNAATGKRNWEVNIPSRYKISLPSWGNASSVIVEKEMLLINAGENGIALDKASGKLIWSPVGAFGYSSPVVFDYNNTRAAALFSGSSLNLISTADGKTIGTYPWKTRYQVNAADPVFFNNRIFISSAYGMGCVLLDISGASPKELWKNKEVSSQFSTAIYDNGVLYASDSSINENLGRVVCLDASTGKVKWASSDIKPNSFIKVDDTLIVLTEKADILILEATPAAYKEIASVKRAFSGGLFWTAPVFNKGLLYIRSDRGELYCIDLRK